MAKITLVSGTFGQPTTLLLDKQDISNFARAIDIHGEANNLFHTTIELTGLIGCDVTIDSLVTVQLTAYPGHTLMSELQSDGRTRYWVEKYDTV